LSPVGALSCAECVAIIRGLIQEDNMFGAMAIGGAIVSMVASALAGPSAVSPVLDNPPADKIVIDLVTVNGSGCPEGTAAVAVSPDNTAFTVTYSNYLAQVGVGSVPTDFRKNCQLNLIVHVPQGFTYAVQSTDYRGFASLEKGATAVERAGYYFQGSPTTTYASHTFTGPFLDDWTATDTAEIGELIFAPCGALRNFNINTELRVNAGTSNTKKTTSFVTMDSTDSEISTVYHFAWARCP
jgi:hypothetical protein